jgi:hypothetical protein
MDSQKQLINPYDQEQFWRLVLNQVPTIPLLLMNSQRKLNGSS